MLANSTSTATSGAFPPQHRAPPGAVSRSSNKKRGSSRVLAAEVVENAGTDAELPPASNTAADGETCSMGNGDAGRHLTQGEGVSSPLRSGKKGGLMSSRTPKASSPVRTSKVPRLSHVPESARPRVQRHLMGPAFSKSLFILVLLAGLATTFWNWNARKSTLPEISTAIQVKELEDFSRKTTKWMQVQLELVDMKIGKEVHGLRKEIEEKLGEKALTLETSIKNLRAQVGEMDASMQKLTEEGLLSKKEGMELIHSIIQQRALEDEGRALSLDDVRIAARQIVEAELEKHSADGIGRVDYALGSGGGKVIDHSEAFFHAGKTSWLSVLGAGLSAGGSVKHPMARKVLEPSFGEPGQCLPLKGSDVFVEIALRTHIFADSITLEHVPKSVAYDVKSAPKDFRVFGWLERGIQADTVAQPVTKVLLGEFSYSVEKSHVQTFSFPEEVPRQLINTVRLHVISNHGSPSHTCIYRVRVHGFEPQNGVPALG